MLPKHKTRGNGQGTAYKRGNTWEAQVIVGYSDPKKEGGQPIPIKRRKGGFATKKDALAYCPILLSGGYEKPKIAPRISHYWTKYSENKMPKIGKSKQCAYKIAWKRLAPIQDVRVDAVTIELLQETVDKVANSFYTKKDCKTVLKHIFDLACADGFMKNNLSDFIELPALEEAEQTPFSVDEQKALWKLYESGDTNARIPLLMIYTGMMPGEAQLLRVEHIDLKKRIMFGMNLKTKVRKKTPVVIADCIVPVVEDLIEDAQPSGYIWKRNEKLWYDNYYAALEAAGCRKLTPYSCRHTTATALAVTENVAPQTIKRVMRWSTTKMLDRYAHPEVSDALNAVNTLRKSNDDVGSSVGSKA